MTRKQAAAAAAAAAPAGLRLERDFITEAEEAALVHYCTIQPLVELVWRLCGVAKGLVVWY